LTCIQPFKNYAKGDRVTDETEVAALMKGSDRYNFSLVRTILRESAPKAAQS
jgi:hypothetical protein